MATIRLRAGKKCLYPDTSTLIYAVGGTSPTASIGDRAILEALRLISAEANLCISLAHLLELARGRERAAAAGALLDSLEIVWLRQSHRAEVEEVKTWLLGATAGELLLPSIPVLTSFLSLFEKIEPHSSPDLLRLTTLETYLRDAATDNEHLTRMETIAQLGRQSSQRFFADRRRTTSEGIALADVERRLDEQLHSFLLDMAKSAHAELVASGDSRYVVLRGSVFGFPEIGRFGDLLPLPWAAPRQFPTVLCFQRMIRNAAQIAARKSHTGTKYFKERGGDLFDWSHAVGAAYCDGFCCDRRTRDQLGDCRRLLGLPPPLVLERDEKVELANGMRIAVLG